MSIVALEAAVCAIPVILTNRCGFDELAKAGGARLVDADADAIAEVTVALMDDADLRAAMGRKGRDLVLQEYTWSIAAERHVAICRQILKGRGA
jgi:Glycosyltransferase